MNIGILIYSFSGNTLSIAKKIESTLTKNGHTAIIERVTVTNSDPNSGKPMALMNIPKISKYDKLIIGAPINGFSLCKAMRMYLNGHADVDGKEINCFVTQYFKHSFLGGNKGIKQISSLCEQQGGKMKNTSVIHWSSFKRDKEIQNAVELMSNI